MMLLNLRPQNYTVSHSSASLFTMLALDEEDFCGSTSSLFLQIYNKMAARRKTMSPMRPKIAGTFIVLFCSLLWRRTSKFVFVLPLSRFVSFTELNLVTSRTVVKHSRSQFNKTVLAIGLVLTAVKS